MPLFDKTECDNCGYRDVLTPGTDCPQCDDGTMEEPDAS